MPCGVVDRKKDNGPGHSSRSDGSDGGAGDSSSEMRKSSYEADRQIEYATSTLRKNRDGLPAAGSKVCVGAKAVDYDVCPYATFSVMQTGTLPPPPPPGVCHGSRTPTHHRALSQTDCYETPDHIVRGLIDKSYGEPCPGNSRLTYVYLYRLNPSEPRRPSMKLVFQRRTRGIISAGGRGGFV